MATNQEIRTALARAREALLLRPGKAQGSMTVNLRLEDGLKCISRSGDWKLEIDEPKSVGGENTAPSPGFYGCSALGGCLAITVKMLAAQADVQIDAIDVEIAADYDDRGSFAIDDVPPGFQRFRLTVKIGSPAPPDTLRDLVKQARGASSWFDVFSRAQGVSTDLMINGKAA